MKNEAILCDCLPWMRAQEDQSFDLVIADPPYGTGKIWDKARSGKAIGPPIGSQYENRLPDPKVFQEIKRIGKVWIIWGYQYNSSHVGEVKSLIIWDKEGTWEKDLKAEAEVAATNFPSRPTSIYRHAWNGARRGAETGTKGIHPHQKPLNLYRWIYKNYLSSYGSDVKVLDPFLGSGSSRIASDDFEINFTGLEIDKAIYEAQEFRYLDSLKQIKMDFGT